LSNVRKQIRVKLGYGHHYITKKQVYRLQLLR
jgi:hypothetical protein